MALLSLALLVYKDNEISSWPLPIRKDICFWEHLLSAKDSKRHCSIIGYMYVFICAYVHTVVYTHITCKSFRVFDLYCTHGPVVVRHLSAALWLTPPLHFNPM